MWRYTYQDELYHYGIKGMKWGIIRTAAQLGHFIKDKAKKGYQTAKRAYGVHKTTKKAEKEFERIMKKPLKDLTDDELNTRLKRLDLEKKVSDLEKQTTKISAGKEFLRKVGKEVVGRAAINASKEVLERWLKKRGYEIAGLKDTQYGISDLEKEVEKARLRKDKASNIKQAITIEDWIKDYNSKKDGKTTKDKSSKATENNTGKAEEKPKNATSKSEKKAKNTEQNNRKVYTGTVSGKATSSRKPTDKKNSKPSDYYDPIYTDFVDKPASESRNTETYRIGSYYVERLLLNS